MLNVAYFMYLTVSYNNKSSDAGTRMEQRKWETCELSLQHAKLILQDVRNNYVSEH